MFSATLPASTSYWFAPGTHTLGSGEFSQIDASSNDTFIGGPGAVLDGQDKNDFAIAGAGTDVTIEYLTVENFTAPESQAVINQSLSSGWVVENSTVQNNPNGAGVMVDTNGVLNDDCLTKNGQYGFQTYSGSDSQSVSNLTITNNEISDNDTQNYDTNGTGTCGCTGGAKFWNAIGATVTGNYIHDNESVGLWMDTNNVGFNVSDNYLSHNWDVALQYEISYNVSITNNAFVDNGWIAGPNNPGTGAIEINNSGSDPRVAGPYNTQSVISGNVLTDNWGGIDLYEDSNRYCSTNSDNTSSDYCTLVDPSTYTVSSCTAHDIAGATSSQSPDYYDNCRWKDQNILVTGNTLNMTPSNIGSTKACSVANGCGFVGVYSEYGTYPPYDGFAVPLNLVNNQNIVFSDNTYNGPFAFDSMYQGDTVTWAQWSGGYTDSNTNEGIKAQDAGSSYNGSAVAPTTTSTSTTSTSTTSTSTTSTTTSTTSNPPASGATPPSISTTSLPSASVGTRYSQTLAARAGTTPYSWSLNAGNLPPGLSLNSSSGSITGMPTTAGTYSPTFKVTDSNGLTDSATLPISVAQSTNAPAHGYWLVGSDGGIFTFGASHFFGSTGSLALQRPVVGVSPSPDNGGYWLVAGDGGVFNFGDAGFVGSVPGLGLHPAGSSLPHSLNAPIVGLVPSTDGRGYFMVASDGGVFAFGDAHFAGSCPGIGGCAGAAVAVMPDASGRGYWVVTKTGDVFTFGDAGYFGAPGHGIVSSAVRTPDGMGYWILLSDGEVFSYGDAVNLGSPASSNFNALNYAAAIFATSDGGGYWISSAQGKIFNFGDAPNDGDMSATHLNGTIVAGSGQ